MARAEGAGRLGARLRAIRTAQGLTLDQVSRKTGVAKSTLSKVENGQMSLTYDKLLQLSEGLEVDISELFGAPQVAGATIVGRRSLCWRGDGVRVETPNYGHLYLFADLANKRMQPAVCRVRARTVEQFGELVVHAGEEFVMVMEGAIEVVTELYSAVRLEQGDSIYLDSGMKHAYLSVGEGEALIMVVCSSLEKAEELPHATIKERPAGFGI